MSATKADESGVEVSQSGGEFLEEINKRWKESYRLDRAISAMRALQAEIHQNAVDKGWWDDETPFDSVPEKLLMIVSEVIEATDEYRDPTIGPAELRVVRYNSQGKPEGLATELADIVIRVFDLAGGCGIELWKVILEKHLYNKTRPHRHGGKRI